MFIQVKKGFSVFSYFIVSLELKTNFDTLNYWTLFFNSLNIYQNFFAHDNRFWPYKK